MPSWMNDKLLQRLPGEISTLSDIIEEKLKSLLRKVEEENEKVGKITDRITHEVEGINRVCLDLTPKPIGTIEWE